MADGEKKNLTITKVFEQPPYHGNGKKHYKVDSDIGVVDVVLPEGDPPPKKGDSLMVTLYPPTSPQYPPKAYPLKGKPGGGRPQKTEREIRSDEARSALIRATDLVIADKITVDEVSKYTREFYGVLKELAA